MAQRKRPAAHAQLGRTAPDRAAALAQVRSIYTDLAARPMQRACEARTECCQFKLTGRVPMLTAGEALLLAQALRASGRTQLPDKDDGSCPMLDRQGRCLTYDARPFGCRTHFCAAAGGPAARRDVLDLIRRLEEVDRSLAGDGAHPLPIAVKRHL